MLFPMNSTSSIAPQLHEFHLENGLRVLLLQRDFAPTFAAYYHFAVGSTNDPPGRSGIAHLLEHMMFKGTKRISTVRANEYAELVTRAGGQSMNATTSYDLTRYYVQLPANQLETWFSLEAQRVMEPVFREFETEREVVLQERHLRIDNLADGQVHEKYRQLLYAGHPYSVPVIGTPEDIRALRKDDAEAYFRTWYSPSNCTMILVGDLKTEEVEALAKRYLEGWQRQQLPSLSPRTIAAPGEVRRAVVEFDAQPYLRMGWVTVPEHDPDHDTLTLLSALLGELQSSRLNLRLIHERHEAAAVASFAYGQKESGSFTIVARPRGDTPLEDLERQVLEVIEEIAGNGVTHDELDRARSVLEANRVRRLTSNLSLAMDLGAAIQATGDPAYLDSYGQRLMAVTGEMVRAAASRFLDPSQRCVVQLHRIEKKISPTNSVSSTGGKSSTPRAAATGSAASGEHSRQVSPSRRDAAHGEGFQEMLEMIERAPAVDFHVPEVGVDVTRQTLSTGTTLFWKEDHELPSVTINAIFTGGSNTAPLDQLAAYALAGSLWLEGGAGNWDPEAIERRKEELGVRVSLRGGGTSWQLSLWTLSRNLQPALELLVTMLREPRLEEKRLRILAAKQIELMRRRADYPDWAIAFLAQKVLYGNDPRLGYQPSRKEIEGLTREDIAAVLARQLGPSNLYLTAVGDFQGETLAAQLENDLKGWKEASDPQRDWLPRAAAENSGVHILEKEIPQPAIRILQELEVDRTAKNKEHAAIEILNNVLGGKGFRSHLMERLRTDEGLTYGVSSSIRHESRAGVPGMLSISFQTGQENVARTVEIVEDECHRLRETAPSEDEVHEHIQAWRNSFLFRFENRANAVTRLMYHELDDRSYDRDRQLLAQIEEVTPDAVLQAAQRWLTPQRFAVSVFGSPAIGQMEALRLGHALRLWTKDEVLAGDY